MAMEEMVLCMCKSMLLTLRHQISPFQDLGSICQLRYTCTQKKEFCPTFSKPPKGLVVDFNALSQQGTSSQHALKSLEQRRSRAM